MNILYYEICIMNIFSQCDIYIYIYIHTHTYIYTYIYIYIYIHTHTYQWLMPRHLWLIPCDL